MALQLWVGLGNPGPDYALHRHNVGFMALDTLAETWTFAAQQTRFSGWTREGRVGPAGSGDKILLLKPATFMNDSGRAVGEALRFFKLTPAALTVFHDELDLPPFKVKVKRSGGHAGHNGLRSIDQHCGPDYRRVRLGIGHPGHKDRVHGYVLGAFAKAERDSLATMLGAVAAEASWLLAGDDARFMNEVALRQA